MSKNRNLSIFTLFNYAVVILPLLIHALTYLEIATVSTRTDGRVINSLALSIYGFCILVVCLLYFYYSKSVIQDREPLIITLLPTILSLVFFFSLFMTKWSHDVPRYASTYSLDTEIVALVNIPLAIVLTSICVLSGKKRALLQTAFLHLAIYFGMYGIPHIAMFPDCFECILGPRLYIPAWTIGIYGTGFVVTSWFAYGWNAIDRMLAKCVAYGKFMRQNTSLLVHLYDEKRRATHHTIRP